MAVRPGPTAGKRRFLIAHVALLVGIVLHGADHVRQGLGDLNAQVFWGGVVIAVVALVTLPVSAANGPRTPLVAAVVGFGIAIAVTSSHIAPHWSAFSYSYPQRSVDAVSWAAMLTEVVAALALGIVGATELRRRAGALSASPS